MGGEAGGGGVLLTLCSPPPYGYCIIVYLEHSRVKRGGRECSDIAKRAQQRLQIHQILLPGNEKTTPACAGLVLQYRLFLHYFLFSDCLFAESVASRHSI